MDEEEKKEEQKEDVKEDVIDSTAKEIEEDVKEPRDEDEEDYDEYEEDDEDDNDGGKKIVIAILVAALIALVGILAYLQIKSRDNATYIPEVETETTSDTFETESQTEVPTEVPTEIQTETAEPTATPKPLPTATPVPVVETEPAATEITDTTETNDALTAGDSTEPANIIFLGDSRFREMANDVNGDGVLWECSASGTYSWLTDTAYPDVDSRVGEGTKILINIGVNDLIMSQSYAQSINGKAQEWKEKGASVYYVSIGPVANESEILNQDISDFNTYMYQNLDKDTVPFIDAYNYLVENGFTTTDNNVYDKTTNIALYEYLMSFVE